MFAWLRRHFGSTPSAQDDSGFTVVTRPDGSKALVDAATLAYMQSTAPDPTQASLEELLGKAAGVRVYKEGVADEKLMSEAPLVHVDDREEVEALCRSLRIVDGPAGHCMCYGDPSLEILDAAGSRLALLAVHHGRGIRWSAWKDDAELENGPALLEWLARHAVEYPLIAYREAEEDAREAEAEFHRWAAAAPPCLSDLVLEIDEMGTPARPHAWTDALERAYPAMPARALALFEWHGAGAGPWSGYAGYEATPEHLLESISLEALIDALSSPDATSAQLEGAARYLTGWKFQKGRGGQRDRIPLKLRQRLVDHVEETGDRDKLEFAKSLVATASST